MAADLMECLDSTLLTSSQYVSRNDAAFPQFAAEGEGTGEREILGFPTNLFGPPTDARVSQFYWEASQLIATGRRAGLPPMFTPTRSEDRPGYAGPIIQYDEQFRLRTEIFAVSITQDLLAGLSSLEVVGLKTHSPKLSPRLENPFSWSRLVFWVDSSHLNDMLQLPHVMKIDFPETATLNGAATTMTSVVSSGAQIPETGVSFEPKVLAAVNHVAGERIAGRAVGNAKSVAEQIGSEEYSVRIKPDAGVYVEVRFSPGDESVAKNLKARGVDIGRTRVAYGILEAWIEQSDVSLFSGFQGVRVSLPVAPEVNSGTYNTAGDTIHLASDVRSRFASLGIDGSGIKIGVISDGVTNLSTAVSTGNLPSGVIVNPSLPGSGDEGTAMLEIIHDLAPGATLYFSGGASGSMDMQDAIEYLEAQGVHIIVDDLTYFTEPFFDDGAIAFAAAHAVAPAPTGSGIYYVSSAGNQNQRHFQGPSTMGASGRVDFNPTGTVDETLNIIVPAFANPPSNTVPFTFTVYLQWSEAFGLASTNFDLHLLDNSENVLLSSAVVQDGVGFNDFPFEGLQWTNNTGAQQTYKLRVTGPVGASRMLEMFMRESGVLVSESYSNSVNADAIFGHAAVDGVVAVGAISASDPGNNDIQAFSSLGPSTIFTNFSTQTSTQRSSLDIVGIDAVDTLASRSGWAPFSSNSVFTGTSAAAPHIAAILGLMKDAAAGNTSDLRTKLTATALDLGAGGYDTTYGAGRANALEAVYKSFTPTQAPDLTTGSDNGSSTSDNVTSLTNLTFTGNVPAGSYVMLFDNGGGPMAVQPLGAGVSSYSLNYSVSSNSAHTFTIRVSSSSSSGNWSNVSPGLAVYVDSLATHFPPLAAKPDLIDDTGPSGFNNDDITTDRSPTFSGIVASPVSDSAYLVTLWIDGVQRGSVPRSAGNTSWTIPWTGADLSPGVHSAVARFQRVTGAPAVSYTGSSALSFTVDDGAAPVATITPVTSPGNLALSAPILISFNKAVTGFDVPDLSLTKNAGANRLPGTAVLTNPSGDNRNFQLTHLVDVTMGAGNYVVSVVYASSGIQSIAGGVAPTGANPSSSWSQGSGSGGFQNAIRYLDVNSSGTITTLDANKMNTAFNTGGTGGTAWVGPNLPGEGITSTSPWGFVDTNGDNRLTTTDYLILINYLNDSSYSGAVVPAFAGGGGSTAPISADDVTADIQLLIYDAAGNQVSTVQVGEQFEVRAFLNVNGPAGVEAFAAFADMQFSSTLVSPVNDSANVGLAASSVGGGLLDEAGRLIYETDSNLIFSKTFKATKRGLATFSSSAADLFGHEIYVLGLNDALPLSQVTFGSTTLQVKARVT